MNSASDKTDAVYQLVIRLFLYLVGIRRTLQSFSLSHDIFYKGIEPYRTKTNAHCLCAE